ncbi:MAG: IS1634 family transposase [Chitinispirillia bacterium]
MCSELLPGSTADVTTLIPLAKRLKNRFGVQRICIVADRGMISATTMKQLEEMGWLYILGAKLRKVKEIREDVLSRAGRYQEIYGKRQSSSDPAPLKVKEVTINNHRYVIYHNEEDTCTTRKERDAIVDSLKKQLKQGDKSFVANKGYRRYVKTDGNHFEIDEEKVVSEKRFDGKYVLQTNTDISSKEVALKYKQLWTVETIFRTMKLTFETRPIFHHHDDTIRGHVFCSFLALLLRKKLQDNLEDRGYSFEWSHIVTDIDTLEEITVEHQNEQFIIRTETKGVAGKVFQAAKIALPPVLKKKENVGTTTVPNV